MSAPLAKGFIIAASIILAAGLAIYENEQIRHWLDEHRRRIAVALYALGDGINPTDSNNRSPEEQAEMAELNRQRRNEIVRRNRSELIRRAQEEGIAVDLDELAALGILERETAPTSPQITGIERTDSGRSFDELVGSDGKLKEKAEDTKEMAEAQTATGSSFRPIPEEGLRHRGPGARGFASGSSFANPFDDDAHVLFDQDLIAPAADELPLSHTDNTSQTVRSISPRPMSEPHILDTPNPFIDIPVVEVEPSQPQSQYKTDDELEAEIQEAIRRSLMDPPPPLIQVQSPDTVQPDTPMMDVASPATIQPESPIMIHSPRSDDSLYRPASPRQRYNALDASLYAPASPRPSPGSLTASSTIPHSSPADSFHSAGMSDVAMLHENTGDARTLSGAATPTDDGFSTISSAFGDAETMNNLDTDMLDARSEAAETDHSFSVIGASTPGSWTDVDSESETEAANGTSHMVRR